MISPFQSPRLNTSSSFLSESVQNPPSPARYAATSNAFGLATSPTSSTSSSRELRNSASTSALERSPPSAGALAARRLRRPSLLGLAQTNSFASAVHESGQVEELVSPTAPFRSVQDPSSSKASLHAAQGMLPGHSLINPLTPLSHAQPTPRWSNTPFLSSLPPHSASPLSIENLTTRTPPIPRDVDALGSARSSSSSSPLDMEPGEDARSPLRWIPSHLQHNSARRKGKARMDNSEPASPPMARPLETQAFSGRPLPAPLLATLISESSPLEHEMRSEARLQRLIASHPRALPFTPRASRSSRGRFPETVDDDDDDLMGYSGPAWRRSSMAGRRASSSDSDSDEMPVEEAPEPVNAAFAAGMDMDRPGSSSSSASAFATGGPASRSGSGSGPGTGNQPTPPSSNAPWGKSTRMSIGSSGSGLVPSPGVPTGLPFAFGTLGVGGSTPQASPTVERLEVGPTCTWGIYADLT